MVRSEFSGFQVKLNFLCSNKDTFHQICFFLYNLKRDYFNPFANQSYMVLWITSTVTTDPIQVGFILFYLTFI